MSLLVGQPSVGAELNNLTEDPAVRKTREVVGRYASSYRASPEEMVRREWRQAVIFINRLRDALGMEMRGPNTDGDAAHIGLIRNLDAALSTADTVADPLEREEEGEPLTLLPP